MDPHTHEAQAAKMGMTMEEYEAAQAQEERYITDTEWHQAGQFPLDPEHGTVAGTVQETRRLTDESYVVPSLCAETGWRLIMVRIEEDGSWRIPKGMPYTWVAPHTRGDGVRVAGHWRERSISS